MCRTDDDEDASTDDEILSDLETRSSDDSSDDGLEAEVIKISCYSVLKRLCNILSYCRCIY